MALRHSAAEGQAELPPAGWAVAGLRPGSAWQAELGRHLTAALAELRRAGRAVAELRPESAWRAEPTVVRWVQARAESSAQPLGARQEAARCAAAVYRVEAHRDGAPHAADRQPVAASAVLLPVEAEP